MRELTQKEERSFIIRWLNFRDTKGWSQSKAAKEIEIPQQKLSAIENFKIRLSKTAAKNMALQMQIAAIQGEMKVAELLAGNVTEMIGKSIK